MFGPQVSSLTARVIKLDTIMCQSPCCPAGHGPIVYSFMMMIALATIPGAPSLHGNMASPFPTGPCLTCGEASSFGTPPDGPSTPTPPPSPEQLYRSRFQAPAAPAPNSNFVDPVRMDIDDEVVERLTGLLGKITIDSKSQLQGEMAPVVERQLCEGTSPWKAAHCSGQITKHGNKFRVSRVHKKRGAVGKLARRWFTSPLDWGHDKAPVFSVSSGNRAGEMRALPKGK